MNKLLDEDVGYVAGLDLPWEKLSGKRIVIAGASGMLGSFLVSVIMRKNVDSGLNCTVCAMGRDEKKAKLSLRECWDNENFCFVRHDVNQEITEKIAGRADYVLHMASNTHPVAFATEPIATITANIIGTNNLLDYAARCGARRFLFASSGEIYGENRGDVEIFSEGYCGYIDSNTLRAGYPESKRCGEALCQAYRREKSLDTVVARLPRSYGATMRMTDTKAASQFIKRGLAGEDIVLKSAGTQNYSFAYVADAVSGLLTVLLLGTDGAAYNVADASGDITLKELAQLIADYAGTKVIFEMPDDVERAGYSTATKALLDGSKLISLGWKPRYGIAEGIKRTMDAMMEQQ